MAAPWSPSGPFTSTQSPGRARSERMSRPAGIAPTPAVLMNSLSAAPRCTTLVSPVTMATPAASAAVFIDCTTRRRVSTGSPSSITMPQLKYSGRAPPTARSLTVPFTARVPMSPPGKNSGSTT